MSTTFRVTLALAAIGSLSACNSARSEAEAAVREGLKDPESAKFGEFYFNATTHRACLTTNAKNAFGGYTGNSESHLKEEDGSWQYLGDSEQSHQDCRELFANRASDYVSDEEGTGHLE